MARGFATPIRSPAARCCRPWVQVWQCCPKVLKASDTGRQKARFLSASKAAVRQMWTVADLNGAPRTFSSSPHGSVTRTTRQKSRCCSRFLTARRRKRSASGANKAERARLRRATWASDSSSRLAIRIFVCLRARSFAPTAHSLRSCPASRSAPQSAVSDRIHRRPAGPSNGACRARAKRVTGLLAKHGCAMDAAAQKNKLIKGWEVVIGMEIHAQVSSHAKLFSGASTEFGGEANSHVSLVDAAMPGMLPVINAECVRQAVRTGLGLKAQINLKSVFDRKNYFYPDLPQGYQISQYKSPIVGEGEVIVDIADGETVRVGIERLHLEQDAGKSLHEQNPNMSLVDLNRAGVALMEIVTKPDLRSAEEARVFITKLRSVLRYLGTCDGDMEKGNLRADVNVSVRKPGAPLGTRCEIKNVNSIRFIGQAIEHEARRQIEIIEEGGAIEQETRLFDPDEGETRSMRSKEEAHDYRYFPDPDLLPLELAPSLVTDLEAHLPELPDDKKARFTREFGLSSYDAGVLVAERETATFFEAIVGGASGASGGNKRDPKLAA